MMIWLCALSSVGLAALFATISLVRPKLGVLTVIIFDGVAVLALVWGWVAVRRLRSAYVLLTSEGIEFRYGRRLRRMNYADIVAAHFRSGYIVLLKAPRKIGMMIPPTFKNSGDLLRRLRAAIPQRGDF
jgi:hypothetical protein